MIPVRQVPSRFSDRGETEMNAGRNSLCSWNLLAAALVLLLGAYCPGGEPAFECFAVTDVVRVFEDGFQCPPLRKQIEVFGIRNEWVNAQCVVRARTGPEQSHGLHRASPIQGRRRSPAGGVRGVELRGFHRAGREHAEGPQVRSHPPRSRPLPGLPVRREADDGRGRPIPVGLPDDPHPERCPGRGLRRQRDVPCGPGRWSFAPGSHSASPHSPR